MFVVYFNIVKSEVCMGYDAVTTICVFAVSSEVDEILSVGFWRWCVGIERIVLLDFIHRLVSQKIEE
jgi:hypothetical protein